MSRQFALSGLLAGLMVAVFVADVWLFPEVLLPGPFYASWVLLAALSLAHRLVVGLAIWSVLLHAMSLVLQPPTDSWASALVVVGTALIGGLSAAVAWQRTRQSALREQAVAEHKRAGEAAALARFQAAELDAILEGVSDGLIVYGPHGELVRMNESAECILGFRLGQWQAMTPEERTATLHAQTTDGRPLAHVDAPVARALRGETVLGFQMIIERPDGVKVHLLTNDGPIRDEEGRVTGVVANFSDISDLFRLQEEREEFIRTVGHDLRQPLTVIQGQAQLLHSALQREGVDDRRQRSLEVIVKNAQRMGSMIRDLVESARLEAGQVRLQPEPCDPYVLLSDIASRAGTPEEVARIRVEPPEAVPPVMVDSERIERVMVNLITNAFKYSAPGAPVTLGATLRGREVVISVADQGSGIPPEAIPHVFERYYRARTPHQARHEGLGLGLYIARLIVEAHGGTIWAESVLGQGTTMSFSLPTA